MFSFLIYEKNKDKLETKNRLNDTIITTDSSSIFLGQFYLFSDQILHQTCKFIYEFPKETRPGLGTFHKMVLTWIYLNGIL